MTGNILLYEELSLNALPALQTQFYDGWILRYTSGFGYTNRANSVNILYPSTIDIDEKIAECVKRYFAQNLPAVFKITDGADKEFDAILENKGYTVLNPTYLMAADISAINDSPDTCDCALASHIGDKWLEAYFTLSGYTDKKRIDIGKQIFANIRVSVICGRIIKGSDYNRDGDINRSSVIIKDGAYDGSNVSIGGGAAVACGLCTVERGYAGLFNIVVDERHRGKGYGMQICASLLAAAKRAGARKAYLQVMQDNGVAINLYNKLGFNTQYSYWYRVKY